MAANDDMTATINRLTGGLINAILGALILWVGQTTFKHAGILASVDEKLNNVKHQFDDVDQRQEGMRKWLENVVSDVKDNNRAQFTMKDGDKLVAQLRQTEQSLGDLERRFAERINTIDLKLATIEARRAESPEVATLRMELTQLRGELSRVAVAQQAPSEPYPANERFARGTPVFLPPVDNRR